ncbi:hypothetical protein PI125_g18866 [Phytophthora idaei]|nr:hypothetical protein PI125_g18866 [Phytophthora idaei]KAG3137505.1 hypothetical protein PI126_g17372 [Phytophthora idaei]
MAVFVGIPVANSLPIREVVFLWASCVWQFGIIRARGDGAGLSPKWT